MGKDGKGKSGKRWKKWGQKKRERSQRKWGNKDQDGEGGGDGGRGEKRQRTDGGHGNGKDYLNEFRNSRVRLLDHMLKDHPASFPKNFTREGAEKRLAEFDAATTHPAHLNAPREKSKYPKKKVAVMLFYSGKGYSGLQINPGVKSIEGELCRALYNAGAISYENKHDIKKIGWSRSARTDRGVHACGNLISAKLLMIPDFVASVNKHLPEQIRVLCRHLVTGGFDAHKACDSRTYEYVLPSFAFSLPPAADMETEKIPEAYMQYRLRDHPEARAKIDEVCKAYLGTHNFHNFTVKRKPTDRSCARYIMKFEIDEVFEHSNGLEFVRFAIHGQSFMLHQIRKMIGTIVMVARGLIDASFFHKKAYSYTRFHLPMAPALGLFLYRPHYDAYDKKVKKSGKESIKGAYEGVEGEIKAFRDRIITKEVCQRDSDEAVSWQWCNQVSKLDFWGTEIHDNQNPFDAVEKKKEQASEQGEGGGKKEEDKTEEGMQGEEKKEEEKKEEEKKAEVVEQKTEGKIEEKKEQQEGAVAMETGQATAGSTA